MFQSCWRSQRICLVSMAAAAAPVIVLTGFGKFNGVEDNPSTRIVERLRQEHGSFLSEVGIETEILEVSVQGCEEQLYAKYCSGGSADKQLCFVHLGVNGRIDRFNFESAGYNNMTFRCADERAYSPQEEKISPARDFDEPLSTTFPLAAIAERVQAELGGVITVHSTDAPAAAAAGEGVFAPSDGSSSAPQSSCNICDISTDPGRFLCNYVYYRSLLHQELHGLPRGTRQSVFVHVPPEERIAIADQVKVVLLMLKLLIESLQL